MREGFTPRQKHVLSDLQVFVSVGVNGFGNSSAAKLGEQQQGLRRSQAVLIFIQKSWALCGIGRKGKAFLQRCSSALRFENGFPILLNSSCMVAVKEVRNMSPWSRSMLKHWAREQTDPPLSDFCCSPCSSLLQLLPWAVTCHRALLLADDAAADLLSPKVGVLTFPFWILTKLNLPKPAEDTGIFK